MKKKKKRSKLKKEMQVDQENTTTAIPKEKNQLATENRK